MHKNKDNSLQEKRKTTKYIFWLSILWTDGVLLRNIKIYERKHLGNWCSRGCWFLATEHACCFLTSAIFFSKYQEKKIHLTKLYGVRVCASVSYSGWPYKALANWELKRIRSSYITDTIGSTLASESNKTEFNILGLLPTYLVIWFHFILLYYIFREGLT